MSFSDVLKSKDKSYFFRLVSLLEKFVKNRDETTPKKIKIMLENLPESEEDALSYIIKKLDIKTFAEDKLNWKPLKLANLVSLSSLTSLPNLINLINLRNLTDSKVQFVT